MPVSNCLAEYRQREHYAEVAIEIEETDAEGPIVAVASGAFNWLCEAYGPNAREGPLQEQYRGAAIDGVRYALSHLEEHLATCSLRVEIQSIRAQPAHSVPDDVTLAAARATWEALGVWPSRAPGIDDSGVHFSK
ncbi:MAG: hypothetical protein ACR2PL_11515 [Dehalococcoidia bacterium]